MFCGIPSAKVKSVLSRMHVIIMLGSTAAAAAAAAAAVLASMISVGAAVKL